MTQPATPQPSGVGQTALSVARARAAESRRADRLFEDPLADAFASAAPPEPDRPASDTVDVRAILGAYVAVRTRFFDDALLDAAGTGCRQMVILGAGLDARAFRLPWPAGTRVFELDMPDVFDFKEPIVRSQGIKPTCERLGVPVDLRHDWPAALRSLDFRPEAPSAWLLEGLLMYLDEADRNRLFERIGALSAPGSRMALEPPAWTVTSDLVPHVARGVLNREAVSQLVARTQDTPPDASIKDPAGWLLGHGWQARLYDVMECFELYGRTVDSPVSSAVAAMRRFLATAERVPTGVARLTMVP
jgi:methyltransferase (TIGR00027 family)